MYNSLLDCHTGCINDTYKECTTGLIFGLPAFNWHWVQHVRKGYVLPCCHCPANVYPDASTVHLCLACPPSRKMGVVVPRMPIFLFNYNDKMMHGIFQATTPGPMMINPQGKACLVQKFQPAACSHGCWHTRAAHAQASSLSCYCALHSILAHLGVLERSHPAVPTPHRYAVELQHGSLFD